MKAMLLAAGLGTRLKPWTDAHPKALALVNGKSLLERNVRYLQSYGIHEVLINVHHFADQIEDAITKNQGWGSTISISDERNGVLETGGGIMKAQDFVGDENNLLVMNVDILTTLNLEKFMAVHQQNEALVTLAVKERESNRAFLFDETLRLSGWENKSDQQEKIKRLERSALKSYGFSGIHLIDKRLFGLEPKRGKFSIVDTYLDLCADEMIVGYDHADDLLLDVGRPESVIEAETLFQ
jgi:N-acetyl-alpha-D-muramate 1-phosphate uridylyltransferase